MIFLATGTSREIKAAKVWSKSFWRSQARTAEEYRLYSNSYLVEIEKMNAEVLAYLKRHPSERAPTEPA